MTVGKRIKEIREARGMAQVELADRAGISKQNLYKYESDIITNIPSDKIERIAGILNVSPAVLMGWERPAIVTDAELDHLDKYRTLDPIDRARIDERIDEMLEKKTDTPAADQIA